MKANFILLKPMFEKFVIMKFIVFKTFFSKFWIAQSTNTSYLNCQVNCHTVNSQASTLHWQPTVGDIPVPSLRVSSFHKTNNLNILKQ